MIPRYTRPAMAELWSPRNRYQKWLDVEIAACEALAKLGHIPVKDLAVIKKKARFSVERIDELEQITKHDVIAFLTNVAEHVGPPSRHIHLGLTSSDVLDTSLAVLLTEALDVILADLKALQEAIREQAFRHKKTAMIGRSHGIHAEPITFGLKLAIWYDESKRNQRRLEQAREAIAVGKVSGAVGTFAHLSPVVEAHVCRKLGLKPAPASSQIVQRDRYAEYFCALAVLAGSIEKMAVEIRHLQRTEVLEAEEFFSKGQKGSSAMPHKRNPIASENLAGLSRLIRGYALAALEDQALWHERDISHSSVERVIGPDATTLIDYMLARLTGLIKNLIVYPENMQRNLEITRGLPFSEGVLLALTRKGVSREEAYQIVQENAMQVWADEGNRFQDLLAADSRIQKRLKPKELAALFDLDHTLKNVDVIFKRVFGKDKPKPIKG
ncbi:MAG: adenylosuccinate lyase [Desulfobacterota bacterium]|jgi:adenylosuccinate lyase|nr:adenylosuccinate lyase [Thermodesulfobacteriota bacterium]